jgi:hypothetical protein
MKRAPSRVVELERTKGRTLAGEAAAPEVEVAQSPMYGVALLKIAMELKRTPTAGLDDILKGVLARMRLDEPAFRRFLEQNGGLLRAIAQKKAL